MRTPARGLRVGGGSCTEKITLKAYQINPDQVKILLCKKEMDAAAASYSNLLNGIYPSYPYRNGDEEMPADVTERRRRSQNLPKKNRKRLLTLLTDEDDRVPRIRYEAPMQAGDKREAFHEPYIPPQWKEPGVNASIPRTRHRRGNRT